MKANFFTLVALFVALFNFNTNLLANDCPVVPTGLAVSNTTGTEATLSWNAMPNAQDYLLQVSNGKNNTTIFLVTATIVGTTYTVTGLTAGLNYKFKVRTRCVGGDKSNWSPWFQFNGSGAAACVPPSNVAISSTTTEASVTWTLLPAAISYTVRVEYASGNPNEYGSTVTTATSTAAFANLLPGQNYKYKIRSNCLGGVNSSWSSWVFFTTPASPDSNKHTSK